MRVPVEAFQQWLVAMMAFLSLSSTSSQVVTAEPSPFYRGLCPFRESSQPF